MFVEGMNEYCWTNEVNWADFSSLREGNRISLNACQVQDNFPAEDPGIAGRSALRRDHAPCAGPCV